ncbi:hypothetical protein LX64_03181 [Chitinophaga skermanii]|uniref:Uncharacterized protein n=1 Tax=Chitinophaga skermanii TaxID=331697 RepID=A0A327QJ58_9BACT|nr:hypothetical protein [Chitinophaga skermanii]RAJ04301.1 hypothetical protein LX64_03181 [Chitinophaga skermanii]
MILNENSLIDHNYPIWTIDEHVIRRTLTKLDDGTYFVIVAGDDSDIIPYRNTVLVRERFLRLLTNIIRIDLQPKPAIIYDRVLGKHIEGYFDIHCEPLPLEIIKHGNKLQRRPLKLVKIMHVQPGNFTA